MKDNKKTYLNKLIKCRGNFWGQESASPALSVRDVCRSCCDVKYWNSYLFKLFWTPQHAWLGTGMPYWKFWGGANQLLCACISFFARTKFLRQHLVTLETFVFDRFSILFLICSKNALVKMAVPPPSYCCRHFFVGTILQNCKLIFIIRKK